MADAWDAYQDAPVANGGGDDPWGAYQDAPKQSAEDQANAAALQQGQSQKWGPSLGIVGPGGAVDPTYMESQLYSNIVKGVAMLPGMPGYAVDAAERAGLWTGKKLRPYITGEELTPENEKEIDETFRKNQLGQYLPQPEYFINPVEEHVTGKLPQEDPNKPLQNIAAAGLSGLMFGPIGAVAMAAGKTAETLASDEYKEAAGLAGMFAAHPTLRAAGNASRGVAERLDQERAMRADKAKAAAQPEKLLPAENAAQITEEQINAAPQTTPEPIPPFAFGRDGISPNTRLISPEVSHTAPITELHDSVGAARAEDILSQTSPEAKEFLGNELRDHFNEHTLEDRIEQLSPHESAAELNSNFQSLTSGLATHPGRSKVELANFFDQRQLVEGPERRKVALDEAFGPTVNQAQWKRELSTAQRNRSAPFWKVFDKTEIPPTEKLTEILARPDMKSSIAQGTRAMKNRGEPVVNRFDDELGKEVTVPTARVIQRAKMVLDDRINNLLTREGKKNQAVDLIQLKNELLKAIDNHPDPNVSGLWREARETWAPEEELKSAYKLGESLLSSKVHKTEVPYLMEGLSEPEKRAVAHGMREHFDEISGRKGSRTALNEINEALSKANREKIAGVIGDNKADNLFKAFEAEHRMHFARNEMMKGSQTGERQLYRAKWEPAKAESVPGVSFSLRDIGHAVRHPGRFATGKALEATNAALERRSAKELAAQRETFKKIREESARILTLQGPERDAALRSLLRDNGQAPPQAVPRRGPVAPVAPHTQSAKSAPTGNDYVNQAMANLRATSRTANQTLDLSSIPGKEQKLVSGLTPQRAAEVVQTNYEGLIRDLYNAKDHLPTDGRGMANFIDEIASRVNEGIVKPGELARTADTKFENQTSADDLPDAHKQFSEELAARLSDPHADPIETAAWIEWRSNLMDHFWNDGAGKASKALASLPLMRAGLPLPTYPPNKKLFAFTKGLSRVDPLDGGSAYLGRAWDKFNDYYHDMVHPRESIEAAIKAEAHPDELAQHPLVLNAVAANEARIPTGSPEQFADPAWRAGRVYDFKGEQVHGWNDAVERLTADARAFSTDGPVANDRHMIIVLGPPAAGKSSISEPLARRYHAALVDSDEAKKAIPEYENGVGTAAVHEESSELAKDVLFNIMVEGGNVVLPKVGHNYESIKSAVENFKKAGYTVDIAHVSATPEISGRRNITRFLKTGRIVPPEYIKEVGDIPRSTAYMLRGEANDFLDADTSRRPTQIHEGTGRLGNEFRAEIAQPSRNGRDVVSAPSGAIGEASEPSPFAQAEGLIGAEPPGLRPHRVSTADGTAIDVAPVVVEADQLLTSQDRGYDKSLQPRQRSRVASQAQVRDIASNLDPERLGYSAEADRGAPIVGQDGMVESGNGRVLALRNVYEQGGEKAKEYRDWLARQGVDLSGYRNPVLIRQRITPMSPQERQAFTAASNQASTLAMSATERARSDAKLIDNKTLNLLTNPHDIGANRDFVRRFVRELPQAEQGALMDAHGSLSAEGATRIRNALFAKAYDDVGVLSRLAESTDDEVRSISNALAISAPQWAKLRADVKAGNVRPDMDLTPDLMEAVKRTAKIRGEGQKLETYLAQSDAFNKIPDTVEGFMRMFYDPQGRKALGGKRISDGLAFYADEARKVTSEPGLDLGLVPVEARDIQKIARGKGWQGYGEEISDSGGPGDGEGGPTGGGQVRRPGVGEGGQGTEATGGAGRNATGTGSQELRRRVTDRTPEGRPLRTEPLRGIGKEQQILEAGAARIANPIPGAEQPPLMQAKKRTVAGQEDLFGGANVLGDGIRESAPQVPGGRQPGNAGPTTPVRKPEQLSLFGGAGSGGDAVKPHAPIQQQPGGAETPAHGAGESVTKPPDGGGRVGEGGIDKPATPVIRGRRDAELKIAQRSRSNYRITDSDLVGEGGAKQKVRGNIEAIKVLKQIEDEGRDATPEEKAKLVKYTGWGAHAQDMFKGDYRRQWEAERAELKANLTDEEYASARASTPNAHYTSPDVVRGMWDAMDHLGYEGGSAIEPSAGIGHFIGLIPDKWAPKTAWTAVELDSITGRIAKKLYGGAEVNVHGFEDLKRPANHYDLAISNVPFGNYPVKEKPYGEHSIHNFFFIKALDKVRPGGIVSFITSSHTMDAPTHGNVRRLLANTSDLVGAIRLPGGSKGAFASNAGTQVTTDIIFLRKKVPGEAPFPGASWSGSLKEVQTPEGPTKINEYFAEHPEMMLGEMRLQGTQYRANEPVLIGDPEGMQQKIAEVSKNMPAGAMMVRNTPPPPPIHSNEIGAGIKDGAFFVKDGKLYQRREGQGHEHELSPLDTSRVKKLIGIRDTYNDLMRAQIDGVGDKEALRADLRKKYDNFVDLYGPINKEEKTVTKRLNKAGENVVITKNPNFKEFRLDPDSWKVASIEQYDSETGKAKPADIQNKDVIRPRMERQINGPSDALAASLNDKGAVDLDHIAQSLGVDSHEAAISALGDTVFQNPDGRTWETAAKYLSGNVIKKLEDARSLAETDPSYLRNVSALEKMQPTPLVGAEITAQFGAPWVPEAVYEDFLKEIGGSGVKVVKVPITGDWRIKASHFDGDARAKYGTKEVGVDEVAESAMNGRPITVRDPPDHDGNRAINPKKTEEVRVKTELLKEAFTGDPEMGLEGWVWQDPERSQLLEGIYNRLHNDLVGQQFDGSHLTLPGLNPDFAGRKHRLDAVWRIIQNGNTLLAHVVGSGKTVTMIASGMEQKRLGLINKPAYVIPNHMLEQFSREFIQAYPDAKILVADKEETTKENRKAFLAKVASNDWDGVIITHDAFGRINMRQEFRQKFIRDQLDELNRVMEAESKEGGKNSPTVKALEKRKKTYRKKLDDLMNEERKDEGTSFEESGIDFMYVDEAHKYKNLDFITRFDRVKGMSQKASQRAEDMFLKTRYLEQNRQGRSAVFATGTPISNTMAEMWTVQRYLQYDKLKERGLETFDAWANTFGKVATNTELAPDGRTFKDVASFSRFVNIPELISLYSEVADTKTADMLKLPRPEYKTHIVNAKPSSQEESFIQAIIKTMEDLKGKPVEKGKPSIGSLMMSSRKIATDGRLVGNSMSDKAVLENAPDLKGGDFDFNPQGKTALAVNNIHKIWENGKEPGTVQMVFLDLGMPKTAKRGKPRSDADMPDEEDKFSVYDDLKQRLVDKGIPAHEVAFIHDATDDIKKAKLFQKVRNGDIRVLIGSTEKMGVGTNVQDRLIAMHHLDAPWKPAEVEQRDGRIVRQGNKNPNVDIYRYVTEKSFDAFMWQTLERKAAFLNQVLSGAKGSRWAEDIDNPLPDAAQMKAAASGDVRILEHAELDRQVRMLTSQKRVYDQTKSRAFGETNAAKSRIEQYETALPKSHEDAGRVTDIAGKNFSVDLGDKTVTERKAAGQEILDKLRKIGNEKFYTPKVVNVGRMSGFDMNIELRYAWDGDTTSLRATPSLKGNSGYSAANDTVINEHTDPAGLMRRFENILGNVNDRPGQLENELKNERKSVERLEKTMNESWPKEKEYQVALKKLKDLTEAIKAPKHPDVHSAEVREKVAQHEATPPIKELRGVRLYAEPQQRASGGRVMAENINHNPTPAQREAGNYAKEKLSWNGIPLTIENAKGSARQGIGKDGKPWVATLAANYGYARKSIGADGDAVDIFLGPHTKAPNVYVIDQIDHDSKHFDEHKAMAAFANKAQAMRAYEASFSDGHGLERIGHVTEMTVDQFKDWLRNYNTTKPLGPPMPKIDRTRSVRWMSELDKTGKIFYLDKSLPHVVVIKGKTFDPADPLLRHEMAEFTAMKEAEKEFERRLGRKPNDKERQQIYVRSHRGAGTPAEREYLQSRGISWLSWEAWCRGELSRLERERIPDPPPNTDVVPHGRGELEFAG